MSIEIQESKKLTLKSHSVASVREKSKNVNDLLLSIQETNVNEIGLLNRKDNLYQKKDLKPNVPSKDIITDFTKNVSCQCSEIINKKNDKEIQYNNPQETISKISGNEINLPKSCSKKCCKIVTQTVNRTERPKKGAFKRTISDFDPKHSVTCQCYKKTLNVDGQDEVERTITTLTRNYSNQNDKQSSAEPPIEKDGKKNHVLLLKKFATVTKTSSFNILVNNAVQTSDCSIILGKDNGREYPLFMRIIYPDKLDEKIGN